MERHFQTELNTLKERLLFMGSLAEAMIQSAIKGLVNRDEKVLQDVFKKEGEVNELHMEIDERCLLLLARHQPMAIDLRLITSAMKINTDLERIGDQAVNVAQNTLQLLKEPLLKPLIDTPRMADISAHMVKDALDSFVRGDITLARAVVERDDQVDQLKDQIFRELLTYMISSPNSITRALDLILISRNLERIADHATNIAEDVIFMVSAKDIRHHAEDRPLTEKAS
jgi:phosphate transport system protein